MIYQAFPVPPALLFLTAATAIEDESLLTATKARIYQPVHINQATAESLTLETNKQKIR